MAEPTRLIWEKVPKTTSPDTAKKIGFLGTRGRKIAAIGTGVALVLGIGVGAAAASRSGKPSHPRTVAAGTPKPGPTPSSVASESAPSDSTSDTPSDTTSETSTSTSSSETGKTPEINGFNTPFTAAALDTYIQQDKSAVKALEAQYPKLKLFRNPSEVADIFNVSKQVTAQKIDAYQTEGNKLYANPKVNELLGTPEFFVDLNGIESGNDDTGVGAGMRVSLATSGISLDRLAVQQSHDGLFKGTGVTPQDILNLGYLPGPVLKQAQKDLQEHRLANFTQDAPIQQAYLVNAWDQTVVLPHGKTAKVVCYTVVMKLQGVAEPALGVFAAIAAGDGALATAANGPTSALAVSLSSSPYLSPVNRVANDHHLG